MAGKDNHTCVDEGSWGFLFSFYVRGERWSILYRNCLSPFPLFLKLIAKCNATYQGDVATCQWKCKRLEMNVYHLNRGGKWEREGCLIFIDLVLLFCFFSLLFLLNVFVCLLTCCYSRYIQVLFYYLIPMNVMYGVRYCSLFGTLECVMAMVTLCTIWYMIHGDLRWCGA